MMPGRPAEGRRRPRAGGAGGDPGTCGSGVVHNTYESTNKSQNLVPLPRRHATTDKRHKKGVFELTDNETAGETRTHPRPRDPAMRSRRAGGVDPTKPRSRTCGLSVAAARRGCGGECGAVRARVWCGVLSCCESVWDL